MKEKKSSLWLPFRWGGLSVIVLTLPVLALNMWERSFDSETRFTPTMIRVREGAALLPTLSVLIVAALVIWRAWPSARTLSSGRRFGWLAAVVVAQVALILCAGATALWTQDNWLFGPATPFLSLRSPDGKRTAYATRECFLFCSLEIHVRQGRSPTMRRTHHYFPNVDAMNAEISWLPDSSNVQVRNLKEGSSPLYFGPH